MNAPEGRLIDQLRPPTTTAAMKRSLTASSSTHCRVAKTRHRRLLSRWAVLIAATGAIFSSATRAAAQASPFGDFNVIVRNNFATSADVEGKIAVKNLTGTNSFTAVKNQTVSPSSTQTFLIQTSAVNGGSINMQNGSLYVPSISALNGRSVNHNGGGTTQTTTSTDLNALFNGIVTASSAYKDLTANSTITIPTSPSAATLAVGTLGADNVAIFNVSGSALFNNSNVQQIDLNLNGKSPTAILINVSGTTVNYQNSGNFVGNMTATAHRSKILWNFYEATSVTANKSFYGSILAPLATVAITGGANEGSIAAYNLSANIEVHLPLFGGGIVAGPTATKDYGDYSGFGTASQTANTGLRIGTAPTDAEASDPSNGTATGDDDGGSDDEDLDLPYLTRNLSSTYNFPVTVPSGISNARIIARADWNNDGDVSDTNETLTVSPSSLSTGTTNVTVTMAPPNSSSSVGNRVIRFRLTEGSSSPSFTGNSALRGEVEDYRVTVGPNTDQGDFAGFGTASSTVNANLRLGALLDGEASGNTNADATADDTLGLDDEDGATVPSTMMAGQTVTIPISVYNNRGSAAYLNAWMDFNGDGTLNTTLYSSGGEKLMNRITVNSSSSQQTFNVTFTVPTGATPGLQGLRVRLSTSSSAGPTGSSTGEVEDYAVNVTGAATTDFGDWAGSGAATDSTSSTVNTNLRLGPLVDAESTVSPNAAATADDSSGLDDEDGLYGTPVFTAGATNFMTLKVKNAIGSTAYLNGWIDFNNDGDFGDAGEKVLTNVAVSNGTDTETFAVQTAVPAGAVTGTALGMRLRLTAASNAPATGAFSTGEVEDYTVTVNPMTPTTCPLNITFWCGDAKGFDAYAFDHGMIDYLRSVGHTVTLAGVSGGSMVNLDTGASISPNSAGINVVSNSMQYTLDSNTGGVTAALRATTKPVLLLTMGGITGGSPKMAIFQNISYTTPASNFWIENGGSAILPGGLSSNSSVLIQNNPSLTGPTGAGKYMTFGWGGTSGATIGAYYSDPPANNSAITYLRYEGGATLADGTAAAGRRVYLGLPQDGASAYAPQIDVADSSGFFSALGRQFIDRALAMSGGCGDTNDFGDWNGAGAQTASTSAVVNTALRLGATVDAEAGVTPDAGATADGADEDGATVPGTMTIGATVTIPVSVHNSSGAPGYLSAWIDLNGDGAFNNTLVSAGGERIAAESTVATGTSQTVNLTFTVPGTASAGTRGLRFRLSSTSGTGPTGAGGTGEVEDYVSTLQIGCGDFAVIVVNYNNNTMTRYDSGTGTLLNTWSPSGLSAPNYVFRDSDGTMLVPNGSGGTITRYNPTTGAYINTFVSSGLNFPYQMVVGQDGFFYIADQGAGSIKKYNRSTGALVGNIVSGLSNPAGLVVDSDGSLLVTSNTSGGWLRRYSTSGTLLGTIMTFPSGQYPRGLAWGPDARLYINVYNSSASTVQIVDVAQGTSAVFATLDAGSAPYTGIRWAPDGTLYVADYGESEVHVFSAGGSLIRTITANLSGPHAVEFVECSTSNLADYGDFDKFDDASSTRNVSLRMGSEVDAESVSTRTATANGDDYAGIDDEDGVTMPAALPATGSVTIPVKVYNNTGSTAYLNAWIDFNNDGTLTDTLVSGGGEKLTAQISVSSMASVQNLNVTFTMPAGASAGSPLGARFRLTSVSNPGPTGADGVGEVEDYTTTVTNLGIGNLVWLDANDDGHFDASEGVSGVSVQLYNSSNSLLATTTTDGAGLYHFSGLSEGTYYVKIPASEFATGKPLNGKFSLLGAGADNGRDDDWDENGTDDSNPAANGIRSANLSLVAGTEPTGEAGADGAWDDGTSGRPADADCDLTVDFGFGSCLPVNLLANGSFETPASGVTFTNTFPSGGSAIARTRFTTWSNTDVAGWTFDPGAYITDATRATDGSRFLYLQEGCIGQTFAVGSAIPGLTNLTAGQTYTLSFDWVPFDQSSPNTSTTSGDASLGLDMQFTDTSWTSPVVVFQMTDLYDTQSGDFMTNPRGRSTWNNLGWKRARLQFVVPQAPAGKPMMALFLSSSGSNPKVLVDNVSLTTACDPQACSVGNLVFNDVNGNGMKDASESGIDSVLVNIFRRPASGADVFVGQGFTVDGGRYFFSGLRPGNYYVQLDPTNFYATRPSWWVGGGGGNGPLYNKVSAVGAKDPNVPADQAADDDAGEVGVDGSSVTVTGIVSGVFALAPGTEPTSSGGGVNKETGAWNTMDDAGGDADGDMTIDFALAPPTSYDFGDYSSFAMAANAANSGLRIGSATTDTEASSVRNATANADDANGTDDEDLSLPSVPVGGTATLTVPVYVSGTIANARFAAWADWDGDGTVSGTNEALSVSTATLAAGTTNVTVTFSPPGTTTPGTKYVRFRVMQGTTVPPFNQVLVTKGEVEDYPITVTPPIHDYGDYAFADAWSTANTNLRIGATVDTEGFASKDATATGDDTTGTDDEDGVTMPTSISQGQAVTIPVSVFNNSGATAYLTAWVDFDRDGTLNNTAAALGTVGDLVTSSAVVVPASPSMQTANVTFTVPLGASLGTTGVRFRLTSVNTVAPTGLLGHGEVEDYTVTIVEPTTDFGDYTFADASATANPNLRLGATVDREYAATKNANADGDDNAGTDDEDGVTMPLSVIRGAPVTIPVSVYNNTGSNGYLTAWIDFNRDGTLGNTAASLLVVGDLLTASPITVPSSPTMQTVNVTFSVPLLASTGTAGVRFRLSSVNTTASTGLLGNGEVEDYTVGIALPTTDFGDYTFADAWATANTNLRIGGAVDTEYASTTNANADGDDTTGTDDEEGVTMPASITQGQPVTIPVTVYNNSGATGYLTAWIDFNRDNVLNNTAAALGAVGDLLTATPIAVPSTTATQTVNVTFTVPRAASLGTAGVRFRLSSSNTLAATGGLGSGEIEDYTVSLIEPTTDFGDYTFADASATVSPNLRLGATTDREYASTKNATADGDDTTGTDDEDAVTMPATFTRGASVTLPVSVYNNTGATAYLTAFFDANRDGTLNTTAAGYATVGDVLTPTAISVPSSASQQTVNVTFTVPALSSLGTTGLRFRLSSLSTVAATGALGNGEVEDYTVNVVEPTTDFGDFTFADASATVNSNVRLGATVDREFIATKDGSALGDDNLDTDDEDAVTMPANITQGAPVTLSVSVYNNSGAPAWLTAWIDLDRDGLLGNTAAGVSSLGDLLTPTAIAVPSSASTQTVSVPFTVPVNASLGLAGVRFRLSSLDTLAPTGHLGTGEVEDYTVTIVQPTTDFGDYATADASSLVVPNLRLGATVDREYFSTTNAEATGDDLTGSDDEDGVTMPASLTPGATVSIPVTVFNNTGATTYLNTWIDFDGDGSFNNTLSSPSGTGERIAQVNVPSSGSTQSLNVAFTVPDTVADGAGRGVRFRLTSVTNPNPTGAAGNGEVEDYTVTLEKPADFGDAPASYGVAKHDIVPGSRLGVAIDADATSRSNATATGDDTAGASPDDEDGVSVDQVLVPGREASVVLSATGTGYFNVWIDFNRNGSFTDEGEHIVTNAATGPLFTLTQPLPNLSHFTVPASAVPGASFLRARFTQSTWSGGPTGNAPSGEVEDMAVTIEPASVIGGRLWADVDADGIRDAGEPGASGLVVSLLRADGRVESLTSTDAAGDYTFSALPPGSYTVALGLPAGVTLSAVNQGSDDSVDSEFAVATAVAGPVAVSAGSSSLRVDGGLQGVLNSAGGLNRLTHADVHPLSTTDWTHDYVLPKFDATLGELTAVEIRTTGLNAHDFHAETAVSPSNPTATFTGAFTLSVPGNSARVDTLSGTKSLALTAFDGNFDFHGTSGSVNWDAVRGTFGTTGTVTNLADFTGSAGDTVTLSGETEVGISATGGGGNLLFRARTRLSAAVSVTYVYRPFDFGDFTFADATAAAHSELRLGATVDSESAATRNATATGDDTTGTDDEDGVTMPATITQGAPVTIPVSVYNNTGSTAWLTAWIDLDRNGSLDTTAATVSAVGDLLTASPIAVPSSGSLQSVDVSFTVPVTASLGSAGVRFRLSSADSIAPTGHLSFGEVEDYTVTIVEPTTDFGDYPFAAASSTALSTLTLGTSVDREYFPTTNTLANGDDNTGIDDETGVLMPATVTPGRTTTIPVAVINRSGAPAYLNAWIDFDHDGVLSPALAADLGERLVAQITVPHSTSPQLVNVTFLTPTNAAIGETVGARFWLTSVPNTAVSGLVGNGEVEDYTVAIATPASDFGDALLTEASSYQHERLRLGALFDTEASANTNAVATGDDTTGSDDEDSVVPPALIRHNSTVTLPVSVFNNTGHTAALSAWIDFNADGLVNDTLSTEPDGECIALDLPVPTSASQQTVNVTFTVPETASVGPDRALRVRLRHEAGSSGSGQGGFGETEDHTVSIAKQLAGPLELFVLKDSNGDGTGDTPVPGAELTVYPLDLADLVGSGTTGNDGRAVIENLVVGVYDVVLTPGSLEAKAIAVDDPDGADTPFTARLTLTPNSRTATFTYSSGEPPRYRVRHTLTFTNDEDVVLSGTANKTLPPDVLWDTGFAPETTGGITWTALDYSGQTVTISGLHVPPGVSTITLRTRTLDLETNGNMASAAAVTVDGNNEQFLDKLDQDANDAFFVPPPPLDTTPPRVRMSVVGRVNASTYNVRVVFSEPVVGLSEQDFGIPGGTLVSLTGANQDYLIRVSVANTGGFSVSLPEGAVQDGGANTNATTTFTYAP